MDKAALVDELMALQKSAGGQASREYISSLWVKHDGSWQQVFMQSTPITAK